MEDTNKNVELPENEVIRRREIAKELGSIKTPKKTAASRENVAKATEARRQQRRPLAQIECTCGAGDSLEHRYFCPRYRAIMHRKRKGLPLE